MKEVRDLPETNPLVSVIIPFYNNVKWLEEAVDSVLNQTYKKFEIIIINDGSPEDDRVFLEHYKKSIIYKKVKNSGPAVARNLGIELAKGGYIAFLDSDDLWLSKKLEKQVELMERTQANWSHTNYALFWHQQPTRVKSQNLELFSGNIFPKSLLATHIATPCVMIRTSYIKPRLDLRFNAAMRYGQDYFLWLNLSVEEPLHLVREELCLVRMRGSNTAVRARAHIQVRAQVWESLKDDPKQIFSKTKNSKIIQIIYRLCKKENDFLKKVEKRGNVGSRGVEIISRLIYSLPYLSFKLMYRMK